MDFSASLSPFVAPRTSSSDKFWLLAELSRDMDPEYCRKFFLLDPDLPLPVAFGFWLTWKLCSVLSNSGTFCCCCCSGCLSSFSVGWSIEREILRTFCLIPLPLPSLLWFPWKLVVWKWLLLQPLPSAMLVVAPAGSGFTALLDRLKLIFRGIIEV